MDFTQLPPVEPRWAHQDQDLERTWRLRVAAIHWEPRLGKSRLTVDTAARLADEPGEAGTIDTAVVVAPNGVHLEWSRVQLPRYWRRANTMVLEWRSGRVGTKSFERALDAAALHPGFLWFVCNVEALHPGSVLSGYIARLLRARRGLLALDEAHAAKNPKAKRTKALLKFAPIAKYRRNLTGTPSPQGPLDLWSQYSIMDQRILGPLFTTFRARYAEYRRNKQLKCRKCGDTGDHDVRFRGAGQRFFICSQPTCREKQPVFGPLYEELVGYRNLEELARRIAPFTYERRKADCLDLPERIFARRYFEMPPDHARVYRELRDDLVAQLDSGAEISAPHAAANLMRLQQISRGHCVDENGDPIDLPGPWPSVDAAHELAEQNPGKTVFWCRFRRDVAAIAERLREHYGADSVALCDGDTPPDERVRLRTIFNDRASGPRFWVGTLDTGGTGVDLGAATLMVFYSHGWNLAQRLQGLERNYGSSQTSERVDVVDLVAADAADERALAALEAKEDLANSLTGARLRELLV